MASRPVCRGCTRPWLSLNQYCNRPVPQAILSHRAASTFRPSQNTAAKKRTSGASPSSPVPSSASNSTSKSNPSSSTSSSSSTISSTASTVSDASLARRVAQNLRQTAPSFTETYVAYGATETLVKECVRPVAYTVTRASERVIGRQNARGEEVGDGAGWWYTSLKLDPTFNNWAQVSLLHMWLVTVRLRAFPAAAAGAWHQHLINHFFFLAEDRLATQHRMGMKSFRQKALKDLFTQWRGLTVAYDEGLLRGDAVLAAAVWRNVCRADPAVDLQALAQVVAFMRSVLTEFDGISDEDFARADIVFGDPGEELELVKVRSRAMKDGAGGGQQALKR